MVLIPFKKCFAIVYEIEHNNQNIVKNIKIFLNFIFQTIFRCLVGDSDIVLLWRYDNMKISKCTILEKNNESKKVTYCKYQGYWTVFLNKSTIPICICNTPNVS